MYALSKIIFLLSQNKISSVVFMGGSSSDDLKRLSQSDLESRHSGWVACTIPNPQAITILRLELKGPDNSLRLRQVKILGEDTAPAAQRMSYVEIQQHNCEAETLKVFRLLTSQVSMIRCSSF